MFNRFQIMVISQSFFSVNFASIVAIVVAVVSGIFSIIATRRSTRPQMVQPYLEYLQKKIDTLSKHISHRSSGPVKGDMSQEEWQVKAVTSIREVYDYKESIISNESDLFIEFESKCKELLAERNAIKKSNDYQALSLSFKNNLDGVNLSELEDAQYKDFHSIIDAMIKFSERVDDLMKAERVAAVKELRKITLR